MKKPQMTTGRVVLAILIMVVLYLAYLLSGGFRHGEEAPEAAAVGLQPVTLKLLFPTQESAAQAEVVQAVEEKLERDGLPFKLEFKFIPFDQYWNKAWLVAASGESYDIGLSAYSNLSDMVSKKVVAPLDEALRLYGQDILAHTPEYAMDGVTVGGQIYGIPRVMPLSEFQSFIQIRGDLRKKYGLPELRNAADMDRYLEIIARNEPGMTPYFYDTGRFLLREYGGDVAFIAGGYLNAPVYIDPSDPELRVKNTYESGFFREIMFKQHEWQRKGYIPYGPSDTSKYPDPEIALATGKVAATWSVVLKQTERIDSFKEKLPEGELENVYLHPEKPKYMFTGADNILSVFSTSKHRNEAVAFLNWVRSSQENFDLFTYGIEGVNYKLQDGALDYEGIAPEHRYTPISWAWNDIRFARFSKYISPSYREELRNWDKDAVLSPTLGFVPDLMPIKSEVAQLNVIISEYLPILYDAKVEWEPVMERFQAKLQDAGIRHVIIEIQKQFDQYRESRDSQESGEELLAK